MGSRLLLVVAVGLVGFSGLPRTGSAKPCRADFPNCRRPGPPPPSPVRPPPPSVRTIYQRVVPAAPSGTLDRARLTRLLVGSAWTRLGSREQIRFVDRPDGQQFARPPEDRERGIRALPIDVLRDRRVVIDGEPYTVTACPLLRPGRPRPVVITTTCLESRDLGGSFGGQGYGGVTYGGR